MAITYGTPSSRRKLIGYSPQGEIYQYQPEAAPAGESSWRTALRESTAALNRVPGYVPGVGISPSQPAKAMQWTPQQISGSTATTTRTIGALPELPEYEEIDEEELKSRTQELSALGRREARSNFQNLLSRIYGADPDDPYAQQIARTASQGFSIDIQRAISEGGREALSIGLQEQQQRNQMRMTAYSAAVNAVLAGATMTTTQEYEYAPTPMQAMPTEVTPRPGQLALATQYDPNYPLSLGQPYTYG